MSDNIAAAVSKVLTPLIDELGFEVVDITYVRHGKEMHLSVYIDVARGVTLDDCETVHRAIDPILDELNPTGEIPYVLNVSSPGLDRPFTKQRDYERNYGKDVEVKLYAPLLGKKVYEGVLKEKTTNTVVLICEDKEVKIEDTRIAFVRPLVKFE